MNDASTLLLVANLAACWAMVGIIWFAQVVHYPLYKLIGTDRFHDYHVSHVRRTSLLVGPLIGAETVAAIGLAFVGVPGVGRALPIIALLLLLVIQVSTAVFQIPAHDALTAEYRPETVDRLVRTNWIRTLGWSARGALAVIMVLSANAMGPLIGA